MPAGRTPATVSVMAHGALVEAVGAGERVSVTGVFRAAPAAVNPRKATLKALHKTHIDALHYRKVHSDRLLETEEGLVVVSTEAQLTPAFPRSARLQSVKWACYTHAGEVT